MDRNLSVETYFIWPLLILDDKATNSRTCTRGRQTENSRDFSKNIQVDSGQSGGDTRDDIPSLIIMYIFYPFTYFEPLPSLQVDSTI